MTSSVINHFRDSINGDRALVGAFLFKMCQEVVTSILLLSDVAKWRGKAKRAIKREDVSSYRESMLHTVKYALSAIILMAETFAFIISLIEVLEYLKFKNAANNYFETIVASNCSMFNSQQMVCAVFLGPLCLSFEALTAVLLLIIIETIIILNVFLTTAYRYSQIDLATVKSSYYLLFWKGLLVFTLISIQFTYIFGITIAYSVLIYKITIGVGKSSKQLFYALKAKGNDPMNSRKDRVYLKKQVRVYKWSTLLIYITGSAIIIGVSVFNIFPKGILELISRPCWVAELYSIQIPYNIVHAIDPVKGRITDILRLCERFVVFFWVLLCIGLNFGIQVGYLARFIKEKRRLGKAYTLSTMLKNPDEVKNQMLNQWLKNL